MNSIKWFKLQFCLALTLIAALTFSQEATAQRNPIEAYTFEMYYKLQDSLGNPTREEDVANILRSALTGPKEITITDMREFIYAQNNNQPLLIDTDASVEKILNANFRFKQAGAEFIQFIKRKPEPHSVEAVEAARKYENFLKWRTARRYAPATVALLSGVFGGLLGGEMAVAVATGSAAALLELQFGWFSRQWDEAVWSKSWGTYGIIGVNVGYQGILDGVKRVAMYSLDMPMPEFAVGSFLVKALVGSATFIASVAASQIILGRLKKRGLITEQGRLIQESQIGLSGNAARVIGTVADEVAGGKSSTENDWMNFEALHASNWSTGTWIGEVTKGIIFITKTRPFYHLLRSAQAQDRFDLESRTLIEVHAGIVREPTVWEKTKTHCREMFGQLALVK